MRVRLWMFFLSALASNFTGAQTTHNNSNGDLKNEARASIAARFGKPVFCENPEPFKAKPRQMLSGVLSVVAPHNLQMENAEPYFYARRIEGKGLRVYYHDARRIESPSTLVAYLADSDSNGEIQQILFVRGNQREIKLAKMLDLGAGLSSDQEEAAPFREKLDNMGKNFFRVENAPNAHGQKALSEPEREKIAACSNMDDLMRAVVSAGKSVGWKPSMAVDDGAGEDLVRAIGVKFANPAHSYLGAPARFVGSVIDLGEARNDFVENEKKWVKNAKMDGALSVIPQGVQRNLAKVMLLDTALQNEASIRTGANFVASMGTGIVGKGKAFIKSDWDEMQQVVTNSAADLIFIGGIIKMATPHVKAPKINLRKTPVVSQAAVIDQTVNNVDRLGNTVGVGEEEREAKEPAR